jgi:hypothetical protein
MGSRRKEWLQRHDGPKTITCGDRRVGFAGWPFDGLLGQTNGVYFALADRDASAAVRAVVSRHVLVICFKYSSDTVNNTKLEAVNGESLWGADDRWWILERDCM